MVRPVCKEVKRRNNRGEMVNYGQLVLGSFHGIECLSHKETFQVLGGKLSNKKPPEYFIQSAALTVKVTDRMNALVFGVDAAQMEHLGRRLSTHKRFVTMVSYPDRVSTLAIWENGQLVFGMKERPLRAKPPKPPRRFWLLVKRLFSGSI